MRVKLSLIFSFFFVIVSAQGPVESFVNNPLHSNANISLLVADSKTGKTLHEYRSDHVVMPASTTKLVTTATALEILGSKYRFETKLEISGEIDQNGVLHGDLYIRGSGDPTLGSAKLGDKLFLDKWLAAVKQAGIREIKGAIIADATLYDSEGINPKWMWEDMGNYYASGAYGISYKDNTYSLEFKSGAVGTTPEIVKVTPNIPELTFDNYVKSTTITYDSAYLYGDPYSHHRVIYGAIPANRASFTIRGDIPNPALLLARDFSWKLRSNGVGVGSGATDKVKVKTGKLIYTHYSPELSEIIREINVVSNNHYAEHLFRHLALQQGAVARTPDALRVIYNFWKDKNLPVDGLKMRDGSGLSPLNAISARFYVSMLQYMERSPNSAVFKASLPVSGQTGTLRSFLRNSSLTGHVAAKSGTITGTKAYAGYIDYKEKQYVFAIIVNHPNAKSTTPTTRKMEEFLENIVK